MTTARLLLGGQPVHRADGTVAYLTQAIDQRFINVFFKKFANPLTGRQSFSLSKRPGAALTQTGPVGGRVLAAQSLPNSSNTIAVSVWRTGTNEIQVYENQTSKITQAVTAVINVSRPTRFTDATGDVNFAYWVEASNPANDIAYVYNATDENQAAVATTSDRIGSFVYKDGYLFGGLTNGRIVNTNLNDFTTGEANAYLTNAVGQGSGIAEYGTFIAAFSDTDITFYRNAGNPSGSPLSRVDEMRITGCGVRSSSDSGGNPIFDTSYKYLSAFDTLFWVNSELSESGAGIYMLSGGKPQKISSPELDTIMAGTADYRDLSISGSVNLYGSPCIVLHHSDTDIFYVYALDSQTWMTWDVNIGHTVTGVMPVMQMTTENFAVIGTEWYNVPLVASSTYADSGGSYTMTVQTSRIDHGTAKRKFVPRITLIGDKQASGTATLEYNDNDYASSSWVTAGTFDLTKMKPFITRCGSYEGGRAYRLTHSANTAFRAEALDIEYTVGSA